MKLFFSKIMKVLLACFMLFTTCMSESFLAYAQTRQNSEPGLGENYALHKTATQSSIEDNLDRLSGRNAFDGNTTDAQNSRWSSAVGNGPHWIAVDLGQSRTIKTVRIYWETRKATNYRIQTSDDGQSWTDRKVLTTRPVNKKQDIVLDGNIKASHVRLYIDQFDSKDPDGPIDWNTISIFEMEVYGKVYQNPTENVALHKTATQSSIEDNLDRLSGRNAFDGNTTDAQNSRWSSAVGNGPHWIAVDLGQSRTIKTVRIYWETRKATNYRIQTSDDGQSWKDRKVLTTRPENKVQDIVLDQAVVAQHVRLYIDQFDSKDPDGPIDWNTISIFEMEVYGGDLEQLVSIDSLLQDIQVVAPKKGDKKLAVTLPTAKGYQVSYNGTDLEQVIDHNLNIYEPIVDKTVNVSFKVTKEDTKEYKFREIKVTVPGTYATSEQDNQAPNILPELQEWKGNTGIFTLAETSSVIYTDEALKTAATALVDDYKRLTGKTLHAKQAPVESAKSKDIVLSLTQDTSKGLMDEGYVLRVSDQVVVEAQTVQGAYFATRTILQSIKTTGNIPCGIARDYPLYKVRGIILDVGRKTFSMNFLKDLVQEMAWYKMNDLQVHLNDNFIFLENYTNRGQDPMEAYSGFRLESDIKKGGNNGLNKADLTSKDVFYTKDEFRTFIKESRMYGVNIVPEFDTPAHALALTKVRPDLRTGTNGRENDHLDLKNQYESCVNFVKSIFNEYMEDENQNPVFDQDTTIHIGADEYTADKEAYRRFSDEMLKFVQASGRKARIWGSLSSLSGTTPVIAKDVQMNLWNTGWANMDKMYEQGFDLINCDDGQYYIVPNAGYYYDYLNDGVIYNNPLNRQNTYIPNGDAQMLGGAFALWNDMIDEYDNGISEYDAYDRMRNAIPLFGAKAWGKNKKDLDAAKATRSLLNDAPNTNFTYQVDCADDQYLNATMNELKDASSNQVDLINGKNSSLVKEDGRSVLQLKGNESYLSTSLETIGLHSDLRVKVKRISDAKDEQILFESPYGSIKAVQKGTGNVGFSRENHDYSFNYTLPVNEWVELEFKNEQNRAILLVNGQVVDCIGDGEKVHGRPLLATTMIPMQTIGSKTHAFNGYVDDVRVGKDATYHSTMELDYLVYTANAILNKENEAILKPLIQQANAICEKFNPTEEEIRGSYDALQTAIQKIPYEKADYSAIQAYVALTKDLSAFTKESVATVQRALQNIRYELPKACQSTVDAYEQSLRTALDQLEEKKVRDAKFVDHALIIPTASSYQDAGSAPDKAFDHDPDTMWHSKWSINGSHWFNIEFKDPQTIDGIEYLPRKIGENGNLTNYEILVSDNGKDYRSIKTGHLANNHDKKMITFDTVTTKHVRINFNNCPNGNGSAAEINVRLASTTPDLEGLQAAIDVEKTVKNVGYTNETWTSFTNTINDAMTLVQNEHANINAVEQMKVQLQVKRVALRLEKEQIKPMYMSATLNDKVSMNVYLSVDQSVLQQQDAYVEFKANDKTKRIAIKDLQADKDGLYKVSMPLYAREMSDTVTFLTHTGKEEKTYAYSIVEYANSVLAKNPTKEVKECVEAMLNYGAMAQLYFNYDVEHLANANVAHRDYETVTKEQLNPYASVVSEDDVQGVTYQGTNLRLLSKTAIRHHFIVDPSQIENLEFYIVKNDEKVQLTPTYYDHNKAYLEIENILVENLNTPYTIKVLNKIEPSKEITITYSAFSYAHAVLTKENTSELIKNVMKSLVDYNRKALSYKESLAK